MKRAYELRGPDRVLHIHHTPRGPEHVDVELRPIFNGQREVVACVERLSTVRGDPPSGVPKGLVAATHKPVQGMIDDGRFRQDLYYRISAFPINLPAVRERPDDIALLVESILQRICSAQGPAGPKFSIAADALARLHAYSWPGDLKAAESTHLDSSTGSSSRSTRGELTDRELVWFAEEFCGPRSALAQHLWMSERTLHRRLKTRR